MTDQEEWDKEPDRNAVHQALKLLAEDPSEGEQRLADLAEQGSVFSMLRLGHICWKRAIDAGDDDLSQAEAWFTAAFDAGSKISTFYLGRLYLKKLDYAKARAVFETGIELGYAPSIFHVGRIYRDGLGVEPQLDRACAMFERAASLDHIYAKRALGRLLLAGRFGFWGRIKGLCQVLRAAIEATKEIQKDPKSERLKI